MQASGSSSNATNTNTSNTISVGVSAPSPSPTRSQMVTLGVGETCAFLPLDARGCRVRRSCTSCLEISGCMINAVGKCVSQLDEPYEPSMQYLHAIDDKLVVTDAATAQRPRMRASQMWQFPAGTVKYCSADDAACRVCTRANFWRSNSSYPDSRFCVGDDGACVCVDTCERRWFVQRDCSGDTAPITPAFDYTHPSDNIGENLWRGLVCMVAISIIVLVLLVRRRCAAERHFLGRQAEARHARLHARSRELGVNSLSLTGWETHRRDLIEKENARFASVTAEEERKQSTLESAEPDSWIQSPRAMEDTSAPYMRVEESTPTDRSERVTPVPTATAEMTLVSYNQATPTRQVLAPLTIERP